MTKLISIYEESKKGDLMTVPPKQLAYALVTTLAIAPIISAESAQLSTSIPVTAAVVANVKLHVNHQTMQLNISTNDIARGYVEVPSALRFFVVSNSNVGFIIDFHPVGNIFESVKVDGLGNEIHLGSEGGAVVRRGVLPKNLEHNLSFRFFLRPEISPGSYPLPIELSVRVLS